MVNVAAIFLSVFLAVSSAAWVLGTKIGANTQRLDAVQQDVNTLKNHFMKKGLNSSQIVSGDDIEESNT